jgi:threonine dehydrogenase-like Zn-dependent dehydrogenase
MKAAVFKAIGQPLSLESRADPTPAAGEAVIKVGRCGICSSDLHMTSGAAITYPPESILGHEYAGEVVAVGPQVSTLRAGDRVTALPMASCGRCAACLRGYPMGCAEMRTMMSGYAEYATVSERWAIKLPDSVSFADGALVEPLACSARGVSLSGIRPGQDAVVLGAGPIGLGAIFWARQAGARRVIAVAQTERQRELAETMGATDFLTRSEDLGRRVAATLGRPPEVVVECIGKPGSLGLAVDVVASGGTVMVLGMCMQADSLVPFFAGIKSVVMRFSAAYELRDFEAAVRALEAGAAEPRALISETIALTDLPAVFEQLRRTHRGCKTLVQPFT